MLRIGREELAKTRRTVHARGGQINRIRVRAGSEHNRNDAADLPGSYDATAHTLAGVWRLGAGPMPEGRNRRSRPW